MLKKYNSQLEEMVEEKIKDISDLQMSTIYAFVKLSESRDDETGAHIERTSGLCKLMAELMKDNKMYQYVVDDEFINNIHKASPLHDIGKVGIPDHILLKAGKLTEEEFAIMKTHVNIGYDTLKEVQNRFPNNSFLSMGLDIISCHHEKWDGSGYPYGLSGTDIALSGRIMAIADVYDALRSKRVYKDAFTHEVSCQIIKEKRGNHLDPYLVDIFIENHRKVEELDYELE
jgi:response regulator RpfG family c-di-GMP phosphodiesterase